MVLTVRNGNIQWLNDGRTNAAVTTTVRKQALPIPERASPDLCPFQNGLHPICAHLGTEQVVISVREWALPIANGYLRLQMGTVINAGLRTVAK